MTEQELKDTVAFFESPAGKKYPRRRNLRWRKKSPVSARVWRDKLSTDILARAREEMKKKGLDF